MDIEKLRRIVPSKSLEELKTMLANAREKGAREHADIIKSELDVRFPDWDKVKARRGGAKPTIAHFRTMSEECPTTKEAYIWLVERFIGVSPHLFSGPSKFANGRNRRYFGRTPWELFPQSPGLADNSNNYVRLSNGWLANVNLNNAQKFDVLARLARGANLSFPEDWNLQVLDPTEALQMRRTMEKIIKNISLEGL